MGVGFKTPYKIWQQKLDLCPPEKETEAMRRGKEKEPVAREEFCKQTGSNIFPLVVKNSKYPFLLASMDGFCPITKKGLEIKVPGRKDHESAMDGVIPEKYTWQLLHQMIVCDLQSIFYFSWNETSSKILEFSRDPDMEKAYLEEAVKFWESVQDPVGKPIEPSDRDYVKKTDEDFLYIEEQWKLAKQMLKEAEIIEKTYRDSLISLADNQCCQGNSVRLTKYISRGRVDYGAIPELRGVNMEQYRKPNTVAWRVS